MINDFKYISAIYFIDSQLLNLVSNQIGVDGRALIFKVTVCNEDLIKVLKVLDINIDLLSIVPVNKGK